MWLLLTLAWARPNMNLAMEVGAEVPLGPGPRGRGVIARVGFAAPYILGDPCGYNEYPECRASSFWPLGGPRVALRGSMEDPLVFEVGGNLGVMHAEVAQAGWIPLWQAEARVSLELGLDAVNLAVGGVGSRSLSWRRNVTPTGYTTGGGFEPLALQLGYVARPVGTERPPTLLTGLGMHMVAMSYSGF